jgi:hypothetical protein
MSKGKSGFIQKRDGDGFVLKPGARTPYRFCCCGDSAANAVHGGCYHLVHDFYGKINDDGEIEITVYGNDEATTRARTMADAAHSFTSPPIFQILDSAPPAPRKAPPMRTSTRRRRIRDENRDAFDENGILRDGHSIRVSLMDAEASRGARFTVTDTDKIAEAVRITQAAMKGDGSRENPYVITTSANDDIFADHKPGWRTDDGKRRRKTVERDPLGREKASFEEDALSPGEIARREWITDTENAWKNDASQYSSADPQTGMATRAIPTTSASGDRWPLSAGEGSVCMSNGRPGKLVKSDDGSSLVCAVEPIKATRADSMTAEEAQPVRDAAYRQYVEQMQNAWKG